MPLTQMNEAFSDMELREDEHILWQGRPQQPVRASHGWQLYLMTALSGTLLIWSFTGPVPEAVESFHEFLRAPFCRLVLAFLFLASAVGPALNARAANKSDYLLTDQRIIIRYPVTRQRITTYICDYRDVHRLRVHPGENGLARVSFIHHDQARDAENVVHTLHAIPRLVAEDMQKIAERASH